MYLIQCFFESVFSFRKQKIQLKPINYQLNTTANYVKIRIFLCYSPEAELSDHHKTSGEILPELFLEG